jgi:hypothetical protein
LVYDSIKDAAMKLMPAATLALTLSAISGCAVLANKPAIDTQTVAVAVRVPAGQFVKFMLKAKGDVTYQCQSVTNNTTEFAWSQGAPSATLSMANGRSVGRFYGGPTWEADDGSSVTARVIASADAGAGNMPLQLLQAVQSEGNARFNTITYIQRLNTRGGLMPSSVCNASLKGQRELVNYEADYVFYSAPKAPEAATDAKPNAGNNPL